MNIKCPFCLKLLNCVEVLNYKHLKEYICNFCKINEDYKIAILINYSFILKLKIYIDNYMLIHNFNNSTILYDNKEIQIDKIENEFGIISKDFISYYRVFIKKYIKLSAFN